MHETIFTPTLAGKFIAKASTWNLNCDYMPSTFLFLVFWRRKWGFLVFSKLSQLASQWKTFCCSFYWICRDFSNSSPLLPLWLASAKPKKRTSLPLRLLYSSLFGIFHRRLKTHLSLVSSVLEIDHHTNCQVPRHKNSKLFKCSLAVNCETKQLVLNVHEIVTKVQNSLFFPLLKNVAIVGVNIHHSL